MIVTVEEGQLVLVCTTSKIDTVTSTLRGYIYSHELSWHKLARGSRCVTDCKSGDLVLTRLVYGNECECEQGIILFTSFDTMLSGW